MSLVAGFMTEYSSMKFAWYFLAEYMNMVNVSAVAATLFLGGWHAPWPASWAGADFLNSGIFPPIWLIIKIWLLMFVFVWIRGSLLRFRYDQFMRFGWKVLIPVGLAWVVFFSVGREAFDAWGRDLNVYDAVAGLVGILLTISVISFLTDSKEGSSRARGCHRGARARGARRLRGRLPGAAAAPSDPAPVAPVRTDRRGERHPNPGRRRVT
ncbi:hypothetical protein GCM10025876_23020 [Demequina litorisediminis]|uniref:NADH-quinone oxidoreductase subunit H n=1 Tax=Demequina litorisediminis TaxID=1849022 RepID=A0ABQ6IE02_9MICO|nr:hypothetical protein GCM10025876_23020 [Demequina litorisediminis]